MHFSLLIRKDLRDLFEQLAISYRSMAVNTTTKVNGVKTKVETKKPQKLGTSYSLFLLPILQIVNLFFICYYNCAITLYINSLIYIQVYSQETVALSWKVLL